jgi:hypothetical protein
VFILKIRKGFVSNSSSTSFTCPICQRSFSGWDWDEDPVCPKCGIHIDNSKSFPEFICEKHNLNMQEEFERYKETFKHED